MAVKRYPDEMDCLGPLRHAWEFIQFLPKSARYLAEPCLYRCMRCDSEKIETYDVSGGLLNRDYQHSPNYARLLQGGRLTIEEYRVMLVAKQRSIRRQQRKVENDGVVTQFRKRA